MKRLLIAAGGGALMLSACATTAPIATGAELVGRTVRVEAPDGEISTAQFMADGTVHLTTGARRISGRWAVERDRICFVYPDLPRECWTYDGPLRRGVAVTSTSDLGNSVRITLQ